MKTTKSAKQEEKSVAAGRKPQLSRYRYPIDEPGIEAEHFASAIRDWNGLARAALEEGKPLIGVLGEKSLHSILKRFVTTDESCYEVRISAEGAETVHRYIADICIEDRIYEIQTGGFYPLIPKLSYYLNETEYDVTVIHPVPMVRYKVWIDPQTGEVQSRKRSPRRGCAEDVLRELFWIKEFLCHPRLHIRLLFLEEDEYRYLDGWGRDKKRGSNRCERVPAALLGAVNLYSPSDYRGFLKPELPKEFTASEFGVYYGFRGKTVYSALKVFLALGIFQKIGMKGRSALYCRREEAEPEEILPEAAPAHEAESEDSTLFSPSVFDEMAFEELDG